MRRWLWLGALLVLLQVQQITAALDVDQAFDDADDDDEELLDEDDEFVGGVRFQKAEIEDLPEPELVQEKVIATDASQKPRYYAEMLAIAFIVVYGINFLYGRKVNETLVKAWLASVQPLLQSQFARLGAYEGPSDGDLLLKQSNSSYKFYCSGRRNCNGLLATFELRKRHDLFSLALALVDLSTTTDTVTLEVPLNDNEMEPFILAVCRKREERKLRTQQPDLDTYEIPARASKQLDKFVVLTDSAEAERELLGSKKLVVNTIEQAGDLFGHLHLTDQNMSQMRLSDKILRFQFNLPAANDMQQLYRLTEMALHFIDAVASFAMTPNAKAQARSKRDAVIQKQFKARQQQRQEALAARKEQLRREQEEKEAEKPLSVEQQLKKEARQQKELLKRRQRIKVVR